jgi:hypothetical protein
MSHRVQPRALRSLTPALSQRERGRLNRGGANGSGAALSTGSDHSLSLWERAGVRATAIDQRHTPWTG